MARVVFFGSPQEAVPALMALVDSGHGVAAVYTRPDAVAGRSKVPEPTPVKAAAMDLGIPVETPPNLRSDQAQQRLASLAAEAFVVAAYGRILPALVLALPKLGALNIHPSLLPRHRGPSPVATAILEGDRQTGVTVMLLDEGMDTGPILAQSEPVEIGPRDTTETLTPKLFEAGAGLLVETLSRWEHGQITPRPQDGALATTTKLLSRSDGLIDWTRAADRIERMTRAYDPWPGTFTVWRDRNLKVLEVAAGDTGARFAPGTVFRIGEGLGVACGSGALELKRMQLEGRNPVSAVEFLRGYPAIEGAMLGG